MSLRITDDFKNKIAEAFYDKTITVHSQSSTVDDEGFVSVDSQSTSTEVSCNVRFNDLAKIQVDYGIKDKIDIAITTDPDAEIELNDVIEYESTTFKVVQAIPFDSHKLIIAKKWSSKSSTSTSA